MKKLGWALLVLIAVWIGFIRVDDSVAEHTAQPNITIPQEPIATPTSLLLAVNKERAKYGVAPLTEDTRLDASAQAKACDMYDNHYFGHADKNGHQGYELAEHALELPGRYSENITQPTPVTTTQAMYNWDHSQPHHEGMISERFSLTGFGICGNDVVEHFYAP